MQGLLFWEKEDSSKWLYTCAPQLKWEKKLFYPLIKIKEGISDVLISLYTAYNRGH